MNPMQTESFILNLDHVQKEEQFGYLFFFVGDDHRLPFATIGYSDNEFDRVSLLDRDGVFRVNIGISKETYRALLGDSHEEGIDYAALNVFMPHPHYAKQHFVCILNPTGENVDTTQRLILEVHAIAMSRLARKTRE